MRLLISSIAFVTLSTLSFAQQNNTVSTTGRYTQVVEAENEYIDEDSENLNLLTDKTLPDGIMLQGTRMVIVKSGVISPMDKDVIFPNGTRVRKDGYIFRKNKVKLLLNVDEYVDNLGKILPITKLNSLINQYQKNN